MEPFRLKKSVGKVPPVRLSTPYYMLLCELKADTGLSMCSILEQCIDYALSNSGAWESATLERFTKRRDIRCPLMEDENDADA